MSNDHWGTPESVLAPIRDFFGGQIDLDPCSNENSLVGALNTFNAAQDGLSKPWIGKVFVNPPYSCGQLIKWTKKCYISSLNPLMCEVILLIPVATSTVYWQTFVTQANQILFYNKRIRFVGAGGGARFDSCLVYYGCRGEDFKQVFSPQGWVITH